jgi:hypothetical protein
MMDKHQLESILKINGLAPSSPDEEIRSLLLSARFNKDEIDTALLVLRENTITHEENVDGLHKVFRTDTSLKPKEISSLLGINVSLDHKITAGARGREMTLFQFLLLLLLSIFLVVIVTAIYMYSNNVGAFHPSVNVMKNN